MNDILSTIGLVLLAVVIFFGGAIFAISKYEEDCKASKPKVIDGKVYRCVEDRR